MNDMIKLARRISSASEQYYTVGKSPLSDAEFDALFDQFLELERIHGILPNSPSLHVGSSKPTVPNTRSIIHPTQMYSLKNVYNLDQISLFINSFKKLDSVPSLSIEPKWDGIAINLLYSKDGDLVHILSRGDGLQGFPLSSPLLKNIPIPEKIDIGSFHNSHTELSSNQLHYHQIRGELMMPIDTLNDINDWRKSINSVLEILRSNSETIKTHLPSSKKIPHPLLEYQNTRNATFGIVSQSTENTHITPEQEILTLFDTITSNPHLASQIPPLPPLKSNVPKFTLVFNPYEYIPPPTTDSFSFTHPRWNMDQIRQLSTLQEAFSNGNASLNKHYSLINKESDSEWKSEELLQIINEKQAEFRDSNLLQDGIVIKVNSPNLRESLGFTSRFPRWAIAYKFDSPVAKTLLLDISLSVSKFGKIIPVARFEPVFITGTWISSASLHSFDHLFKLFEPILNSESGSESGSNQTILSNVILTIEKGGSVIPKISAVEIDKTMAQQMCGIEKTVEIDLAKLLSSCPCEKKAPIIDYHCSRYSVDCPFTLVSKIQNFVDCLEIPMLGEHRSAKIAELVTEVSELYNLTLDQLEAIDGIGAVLGPKIYECLRNPPKPIFSNVLQSLSIPSIGTQTASIIASNTTWEDFKSGNIQNLQNHLAPVAFDNLVKWFGNSSNLRLLQKIPFPVNPDIQNNLPEPSMVIVITGDCKDEDVQKILIQEGFPLNTKFSRKELQNFFASRGIKVANTITTATKYLLITTPSKVVTETGSGSISNSKTQKAEKYGVPIISIIDFLKL